MVSEKDKMWNFEPLKRMMDERGITQLDIVRGAEIAPLTVKRLLDGKNVTLDIVQRVAEYMDVDMCELMGENHD